MKKIIIVISILFFGVLCKAQINPDSLVTNQITKEVVEKLSNEELINLIKEIELMKYNQGFPFTADKMMTINQQFRIFFILIFCIMIFIILLILIPFYLNLQKTKNFNKMINGFVEKGQEIPKELILSVYQAKADLHKSIILISTGIGISFVLILLDIGGRIWSIGFIPVIIGIGYLVSSRLEK